MGIAEHNVILGICQNSQKPEREERREAFNKRLAEYEDLKSQFDSEVKEFNESYDALQAWAKDLEERKVVLGITLEQLQQEEKAL